jgi:hypothetical protein
MRHGFMAGIESREAVASIACLNKLYGVAIWVFKIVKVRDESVDISESVCIDDDVWKRLIGASCRP